MLQPGDRIGPLRVERALGAGGMGEVWLARDERLERLVAIKLLTAESSLDPAARGRMLREARAASALKHPGRSSSSRRSPTLSRSRTPQGSCVAISRRRT